MKESKPYENRGRKLMREFLEQYNPKKIVYTKEEFNPVDILVKTAKNAKIAVELKVRNVQDERFDDFILELIKYEGMKQKKQEYKMEHLWYCLFFGDDILYLFNPESLVKDLPIQKKYLPETTAVRGNYILKDCYMLPKNKGVKFVKVNGVWNKSEN